MKRLLCLLSVLLFVLCACTPAPAPTEPTESTAPTVPSSSSSAAPTTESTTEPTTETTTEIPSSSEPQESYTLGTCSIQTYRDDAGAIWAMGIAEIVNTSDTPLFLDYGSFTLLDAEDNVLMTVDSVAAYPQVLLPNERGYYFEVFESDLPSEQALQLVAAPEVKETGMDAVRCTVTDTQLRNSPYGGVELSGRIENTTDADGELVCIAALLFDEDGALLGVLTSILTETLKVGAQTDFTVDSFMLPPELKAEQVKDMQVLAYPLQEQP